MPHIKNEHTKANDLQAKVDLLDLMIDSLDGDIPYVDSAISALIEAQDELKNAIEELTK